MDDNQKYNKRRRSYTEFRTSYSDNKKYFISTDKNSKWVPFVKYLLITVTFLFITLCSFLVTDALLDISEKPYDGGQVTEKSDDKAIDDKYFQNQVTIPADKAEDNQDKEPLE